MTEINDHGSGKDEEIRVLLFVQDEYCKQKYLDVLKPHRLNVSFSATFFHLSEEISAESYHGLFLDLPSKLKAIKVNKAEVYHLADKFPVVHLQIDRGNGQIRCFHDEQNSGRTLLDFIQCLHKIVCCTG